MTTLTIKYIALILMLIDHIGYFFIPYEHNLYILFRGIGRLSAPLFWYCFSIGYLNTSNKKNYFNRLCLATTITGTGNLLIDYFQTNTFSIYNFFDNNMFIVFILGILFLEGLNNIKKNINSIFLLFISLFFSIILPGYKIIPLIIFAIFYYIKDYRKISVYYIISSIIFCLVMRNQLQLLMIFSLLIIFCDNHKKPKKKYKYFFYLFYTFHIWIFKILSGIY